jgi:short-subunit dehydrogenase
LVPHKRKIVGWFHQKTVIVITPSFQKPPRRINMKVFDKVIVVTGAGSGIGRALVLELLMKGAEVAAVDIKEESLKETMELAKEAGKRLSIHIANITDRSRIEALPEEVIKAHKRVDAIINNAGIIQPFVPVADLDYPTIDRMMNVNFYGAVYMVKSFLPHLMKRPEAHIVNISSMGGFLPVPGQTVYGASKAAVKLFTEGLHSELVKTNVKVTLVMPGGVATNIMANAGIKTPAMDEKKSAKYKLLMPGEAAKIIVKAMEKDQYRVLAGSDARFMDKFYRLCPKKAAAMIAKRLG